MISLFLQVHVSSSKLNLSRTLPYCTVAVTTTVEASMHTLIHSYLELLITRALCPGVDSWKPPVATNQIHGTEVEHGLEAIKLNHTTPQSPDLTQVCQMQDWNCHRVSS